MSGGEPVTIRVARRIFVGNLSWQTSWQVGAWLLVVLQMRVLLLVLVWGPCSGALRPNHGHSCAPCFALP